METSPSTQPKATGQTKNTDSGANTQRSDIFSMFDGILRNQETYFAEIFEGKKLTYYLKWFFLAVLGLTALYGFSMGAAGFRAGPSQGFMQMLSSGIKVPMLYLLSVLVCYPVLYFVIVIMGSKLNFIQTFVLILMALMLNSILLAGCAPIVLFFTFTGSSYEFIKLLHVVVFVFSGGWAMLALWRGLTAMCEKSDLYPKQAIKILQVWVIVFGFVGTQMAWSLRPFVGDPGQEFQIVRTEQAGNFYQMVWNSIIELGRNLD
jgi:hypothetical protein